MNAQQPVLYFDWAATSFHKPNAVKEAMLNAMDNCASASRGGYGPGIEAGKIEFQTRKKLCDFFGGEDVHNVIFTKNITEACNLFLFGLLKEKDHVITSHAEHNAVLRPLFQLQQQGVEVSYLPLDERGRVKLDELDSMKRPNTKLVVFSHASNVTGNQIDLSLVSKWCHDHGILFALDTAQTAGEVELNMKEQGIDILLFTGHKSLLGPQGSGGMIFRKDYGIRPIFSGGTGIHSFQPNMPWELPTRLEFGTANIPAIAGLYAGVDYLQKQGIDKRHEKASRLAKYFYEHVKEISGIHCYGDFSDYEDKRNQSSRVAVVSFNIRDIPSSVVGDRLWREGRICVRAGSHCAPYVHRHFATEAQGMVRFSFSAENSVWEVEKALQVIQEMRE